MASVMLAARVEMSDRARQVGGVGIGDQHVQRGVAQRPATGARRVGGEVAGGLQRAVQPGEQLAEVYGDAGAQGLARGVDRGRVGLRGQGGGEVRLARQLQQQRLEGVVGCLVLQRPAQRLGEAGLVHPRPGRRSRGARISARARAWPASQRLEQVRVGGEQDVAVPGRGVGGQHDGGGEAAQRRQHRQARHALQTQAHLGVV